MRSSVVPSDPSRGFTKDLQVTLSFLTHDRLGKIRVCAGLEHRVGRSPDNSAVQRAVLLNKLSRLLSFSLIRTVVTCLDLTLILATGVLTGIGYHLVPSN